jgi:hypothetical protein
VVELLVSLMGTVSFEEKTALTKVFHNSCLVLLYNNLVCKGFAAISLVILRDGGSKDAMAFMSLLSLLLSQSLLSLSLSARSKYGHHSAPLLQSVTEKDRLNGVRELKYILTNICLNLKQQETNQIIVSLLFLCFFFTEP